LIANPKNPDHERELTASTGSFLVLGSVLFLLERLGTPETILTWALISSVFAIAIIFSLSGRTTSASAFFCASRNEGLSGLVIGGMANTLTVPVFLLIVFLQAGGSTPVLVLIAAIIIGYGTNSWFFAKPFRKSGAYSVPDFTGFRFNSKVVRFLSSIIVVMTCIAFLYAELRMAGLYLAPILQFSYEHVSAAIMVIAAFAGLVGGVLSISRMRSALILLTALTIILPAMWLALGLTGIPVPQLAISLYDPIIPGQALIDNRLAQEFEFAFQMIEQHGFWLPLTLIIGIAALPQISNRSFLAQSAPIARRGQMRAIIFIGLLLTSIPALYYATVGDAAFAMPLVLRIFVPTAVLMIAISTSSLLLVVMANAVSHDGYQLLRPGKVPPTRQMFFARITIVIIAYGGWYYAISPNFGALSAIIWGLILSAACLLPVLLVSVYWDGASKIAVLLGMISGFVIMVASFLVIETELGRMFVLDRFAIDTETSGYSNISAGFISMVINLTIIYFVSLFSRPNEEIIARMKNLDDPGKEILISENL
jgi:Na+(H+)/acetate symporter ActP